MKLNPKLKGQLLVVMVLLSGCIVGIKGVMDLAGTYQASAPDILVNQIGFFSWETSKEFLVQHDSKLEGGKYQLVNTADGQVVFEGELTYAGILWEKHYWKGNFSSITNPGKYFIRSTFDGFPLESKSYTFEIGTTIFNAAATLGYQFFYYQRCGTAAVSDVVAEYVGHEACHMDDASFINGTYRQVYGGWHDAGDYNKYFGLTGIALLSLVLGYEANPAFYSTATRNNTYPNATNAMYHGNFPDILEEAIWGADYVVRLTRDDGFMYNMIGSNDYFGHYGFWGPPDAESDGNPATLDDNRKLYDSRADVDQALMAALALYKLARFLFQSGVHLDRASIYRDFAGKIFGYFNPLAGANLAIKALIYHEVFLATGNGTNEIVANNIGFNNLNNATILNWAWNGFGHIGVDNSYAFTLLWALSNGSSSVLTLASQRIQDRWNGFWGPNYDSADPTNYFHILKGKISYNEYENGTPIVKTYDEYFYDRYRDNSSDWNVGHNSYYLCAAWANLIAYRVNHDYRHLDFAVKMFDWILGKNPFNLCMCEGAGTFNPPMYHNRACWTPGNPYGKVPGCVPNGIVRAEGAGKGDPILEKDLPYWDFEGLAPIYGSAEYTCTEPWIPHNAYFILATSALANATAS
jgi:hypothetical protein